MPEGTTDAAIIGRALAEPELFSMIFDRYFPAIRRYAAARLGPAAADDIAAGTFLIAFDRRDRYDPAWPDARAWLYGIATHLIGRHRRDEVRLYRALGRSAARDEAGNHADRVSDQVTAERLSPELARGLARLSQGDRDALLLVACAQFSYTEVAQALAIPIGTVGSRVNRARRKLRTFLGPAAQEAMNHG